MTTATGSSRRRRGTVKGRRLGIVVGYDGSPQSQVAVRWAALEAARRGRTLDLIHVVDFTGAAVDVLAPPQTADWARPVLEAGRATADEGLALARDTAPGVPRRAVVDTGAPVQVLVEMSSRAELVVVGTRGRGSFTAACLGSVSTAVAAHAFCPVVIVRGEHPPTVGPSCPVVVGVDGSPASDRAVDVAAGVATRTGAALSVVSVWTGTPQDPSMSSLEGGLPTRADVHSAARSQAEQVADRAVEQVLQVHPDLDVRRIVVQGYPARALTEAAEGAGLLVVGSRGRGAFAGLVLGSVSHGVAQAAVCPVMVVRTPKVPSRRAPEPSEPVHVLI